MKETERQLIVEQINNKLKEEEQLDELQEELAQLKQDPTVKKYIELSKRVNSMMAHAKCEEPRKRIVYNAFNKAYVNSQNDFDTCEHEMWLYVGSYYESVDYAGQKFNKKLQNESYPGHFVHNKYICIDCGKTIETENWKLFEQTHRVLKEPKNNMGIYEYLQLYYEYLYTCPIEEAREKFAMLFIEQDTSKKLTKKQGN